jgi:hypothetical protein
MLSECKKQTPFQLEHSEAINLIFLGAAIRKYLARVHETILGILHCFVKTNHLSPTFST